MEARASVLRLFEYLDRQRDEEKAAREQSVIDEWEAITDGRLKVNGSPEVVMMHGVARPVNTAGMEVTMRLKRIGLLNEAGYYHDRQDEVAGAMELLGCKVDRTME
jgi:hypothetical protein